MSKYESPISKNLKFLREYFHLTQEQLALKIGVKRELISYYENGDRTIPTYVISRIAEIFNIDEYDLYELDETKLHLNQLELFFRKENLSESDEKVINDFKRVVKNYCKMQKLDAKND